MRLNELSCKLSQWFSSQAPLSDIVISSRIRLARNLAGYKFISRCDDKEKQEILQSLKETILSLDQLGDIFFVDIAGGSSLERDLLIERQLISRNLAAGKGPRGVVIAQNELFAAQINEEDP